MKILLKQVVVDHKREFVSELFVNISGAVLAQVISNLLGGV